MAKKTPQTRPGQPTLYKEEYAQRLIDYFSEPPYKMITKKIVTKQGDVIEVEQPEATDFKSLAAFANRLGVHRETLLNWTKDHPEFFDAYKRAKEYQEEFLTINGNKGLINPAFGIFTAKNVIDYRDKRDIDVKDTTPERNLSDDELNARLEAEINERVEQELRRRIEGKS